MNAYVYLENFSAKSGGKWCTKPVAIEYFDFVEYRSCPINHKWPDLAECLQSEWQPRSAWLPHLQVGESLTEAIELTKAERSGACVWAALVIAAAYASVPVAGGSLDCPSSSDEGPAASPDAPGKRRRGGRSGGASGSASGSSRGGKVTRVPRQPMLSILEAAARGRSVRNTFLNSTPAPSRALTVGSAASMGIAV